MLETDKLMFEHELTPEDNIIVNYCNSRQQNSTQLFTVTCKIDNVIICMLIDPGCTKTLMSQYFKDKIETIDLGGHKTITVTGINNRSTNCNSKQALFIIPYGEGDRNQWLPDQ